MDVLMGGYKIWPEHWCKVGTENSLEISFIDVIMKGTDLTLGIYEWTDLVSFYGSKYGMSLAIYGELQMERDLVVRSEYDKYKR